MSGKPTTGPIQTALPWNNTFPREDHIESYSYGINQELGLWDRGRIVRYYTIKLVVVNLYGTSLASS